LVELTNNEFDGVEIKEALAEEPADIAARWCNIGLR
jgi:hypothetical protein